MSAASFPSIHLRTPSTYTPSPPASQPSSTPQPQTIPAPPLAWIEGTWNVTHSTLPMWKKSRNVRITYTRIPSTSPVQIDDEVSYQTLSSTKLKTIHGVDKPFEIPNAVAAAAKTVEHVNGAGAGAGAGAAYVRIPEADTDTNTDAAAAAPPMPPQEELASLGYNWRGKGFLMVASSKWEILGYGDEDLEAGAGENQWVATYFAKTLFTPAGVDFYSRKGQLKPDTVERLKAALVGLGGEVAGLATSVFAVALDGERD
ncbi:hypothetical protein K504DRAFT_486284 [Pleomassaria siparia CBS 279.74]|uniref:Uncharacterized protein n=1 Tax=Pleomassaria siparia CBS 279.74 TaxID=1314801 RepID=A0A6G1KNB9_9PLEO|nr:hypothetical protein K504DRAFT_486284 [Pleomassaria siparia CBS 279.74]